MLRLSIMVFGCAVLALGQPRPDVVLTGVITHADDERYKEVPFTVPEGVTRLTVEFAYTGREQRTTIDLGIFDGERFRGWSGGNKASFTIAETDATPSFLPGPIRAGRWFLLLGIPNIRPNVRSEFTAKIYFGHAGEGFGAAVGREEPGWYRGDLHTHTGHSDGSCLSQNGVRVPCPVFKTVQAAAERGLDFIGITDHNTDSQMDAMRELQGYFDRVLLIPGREITTFRGHANVFGPVDFIDFRLGSKSVPDFGALADEVERVSGLISINHPMLPTGENCMGCGWTVGDTDFRRIRAVEIVNGDRLEGIAFWESLLNRGLRVTAVGGSDNHDAGKALDQPGSVGYPETVVRAQNLTQDAILEGIRAGHVFLDLEGSKNRLLECTATAGTRRAEMGDALEAGRGETIHLTVRVANADGSSLAVIQDGQLVSGNSFEWTSDGQRHWVRVVVRSAGGKPILLGNPIFINF